MGVSRLVRTGLNAFNLFNTFSQVDKPNIERAGISAANDVIQLYSLNKPLTRHVPNWSMESLGLRQGDGPAFIETFGHFASVVDFTEGRSDVSDENKVLTVGEVKVYLELLKLASVWLPLKVRDDQIRQIIAKYYKNWKEKSNLQAIWNAASEVTFIVEGRSEVLESIAWISAQAISEGFDRETIRKISDEVRKKLIPRQGYEQ